MLEVFFGCLQKGGDGNTLLNIGVYYLSASRVGWPSSPITRTSHDKQSLGVGGDTTIWPSKWGTPNEADRGILVFMMVGETSWSAISKFDIFWGWWVPYQKYTPITKLLSCSHTPVLPCNDPMTVDCIFSSHLRDAQSVIFRLVVFFWNLEDVSHERNAPIQHLENISKWVFPKIGVPPKHPKMIIFSRKTHGCWGNPPCLETSK